MLARNNQGFYTLTMFSGFKEVIHGFSTSGFGNMKPFGGKDEKKVEVNLRNFLKTLGVSDYEVIRAEQVHSNKVAVVSKKDAGKKIKGVDGLVTKDKDLILSVFVADCLPILAVNRENGVIGIAHVGWQGTLDNIAKNLIEKLIQLGAEVKNIKVGLGPAIEFCHYEVGEDIADKFEKAGLGQAILKSVSDKKYLDLKQANSIQLKKVDVLPSNIDASVRMCTFESNDFYSYRREKEHLSGEIAAVITLKG